jgi:CMP/dCMP kinase
MSSLIIAIDGPAGSGKSTTAKAVARQLGWSFLDTGAMYRAVTAEALRLNFPLSDEEGLGDFANKLEIHTLPRVTVNGRDVEDEIRSDLINQNVSIVASNAAVRSAMVSRQRDFAYSQPIGTVVEGRDITTVVFPDATLKVFLTASLEERAKRRGEEGAESLARRDEVDSSREASPLRQAEDAIVVDTTGKSVDQVVEEIISCLKNTDSR